VIVSGVGVGRCRAGRAGGAGGCGLGDDGRVLARAGDDLHGGEGAEDEPSGGDGGPAGVQAFGLGLVLFGEALPDLAFYQAEDEQGEADHGDQGGDAAVVLAEQGGDGEGTLERGVAAFDGFLALVEEQDPGGVGLARILWGARSLRAS
jgi:hypothetical protein